MPSDREPGGNYASEPGRSSTGVENDDRRSSTKAEPASLLGRRSRRRHLIPLKKKIVLGLRPGQPSSSSFFDKSDVIDTSARNLGASHNQHGQIILSPLDEEQDKPTYGRERQGVHEKSNVL